MDFDTKFENISPEDARAVLKNLIRQFCEPAFGALPKREIELSIFEAMRELGVISKDASMYQLMSDLRITRSKANALVFDLDVRQMADNKELLDNAVKKALVAARFAFDKNKGFLILEIENPLINAHLKEKVRKLGHITDTSFNSAIIKMTVDAVTDLMETWISEEQQEEITQALIDAGAATDGSFKGVLKSALSKLAEKVVGKAADNVADEIVDYGTTFIKPLFSDAKNAISDTWQTLFTNEEE